MDPLRVEAYLRSICSVLDFDIGELWCARKEAGKNPTLKFIQLYTSDTYVDFHSLLIHPVERKQNQGIDDEEEHRFSPIICRGVCDGGQIVWANTRESKGLTGRSDLPLNTAVGIPIGSIGDDLYILVLFAVRLNEMTPSAVNYLCTVCKAVISPYSTSNNNGENNLSDTPSGFLRASKAGRFVNNVTITAANTQNFVGLWDISKLIQKYSSEVEFHLLPLGTLEKFFDYQEVLLFGLFEDFKRLRDGKFSDRQIGFLQNTFEGNPRNNHRQSHLRSRSNSICSESSRLWGEELNPLITSEYETKGINSNNDNAKLNEMNAVMNPRMRRNDISCVFSADFANTERLPRKNELTNMLIGHTQQQQQCQQVDFRLRQQGEGTSANDSSLIAYWNRKGAAMLEDYQRSSSSGSGAFNADAVAVLQVYTMMAYKQIQGRFHEFMISVLGMTVFDGAELWLSGSEEAVEQEGSENMLMLVAAVYKSRTMQRWVHLSRTMQLSVGEDVAGQCMQSSQPVWDSQYSSLNSSPEHRRTAMARQLGIRTAFSVPVPGCGVLSFYSSNLSFGPDQLVIQLIEKAVNLMTPEVQKQSLTQTEVENIEHAPQLTMAHWLRSGDMQQQEQQQLLPQQPPQNYGRSANQFESFPLTTPLQLMHTFPEPMSTSHTLGMPILPNVVNFCDRLAQCRSLVTNSRNQIATQHSERKQDRKRRQSADGSDCGSPTSDTTASSTSESSQLSVYNAAMALTTFGRCSDQPQNSGFPQSQQMECVPCEKKPRRSNSSASTTTPPDESEFALFQLNYRKDDPNQSNNKPPPAVGDTGRVLRNVKSSTNIQPMAAAAVSGTNSVENNTNQSNSNLFFNRKCHADGCMKCAQGATKYCIGHGGGKRCTFAGCDKGARDKLFCAAHGGGKRCSLEGCGKAAVGGSSLCTAHGGGKRCSVPNCSKSSQSSTSFCVKHGGGKTCKMDNCNKVARGRTDYCAAHGGGTRCVYEACSKLAVSTLKLCRYHSNSTKKGLCSNNNDTKDTFPRSQEKQVARAVS
mmetsp:Transcript_33406/g.48421  ORF Transcript_33406/g.48421 Transcript_33406/m.48421 type:complete len:1032 (-) Transcript_33406:413-3508(-)|eukprot:CAMPEP_0170108390 /NCGR_PEP_ID=MMETSP0020_2-20130122/6547_1 /TAXON_ID=98059 /ORGANISM="Dinobryon sp., Strain UTEXLB2267" /LENGTH=1031 /DNA_ID=CAMNT_0010333111 /DNA_START=46 /DNA_END=3141 /DNA_ORIENTATION=-